MGAEASLTEARRTFLGINCTGGKDIDYLYLIGVIGMPTRGFCPSLTQLLSILSSCQTANLRLVIRNLVKGGSEHSIFGKTAILEKADSLSLSLS